MTIYVDDGETVKIYPVKVKVAKAVMTLLELDDEQMWSETHKGYSVALVDKTFGFAIVEKTESEG